MPELESWKPALTWVSIFGIEVPESPNSLFLWMHVTNQALTWQNKVLSLQWSYNMIEEPSTPLLIFLKGFDPVDVLKTRLTGQTPLKDSNSCLFLFSHTESATCQSKLYWLRDDWLRFNPFLCLKKFTLKFLTCQENALATML